MVSAPPPNSRGAARGGVWRGHFPALTDGAAAAGIRAPQGLDLARRAGSADGLGWGLGAWGGPVGRVTAVPQPCLIPTPFSCSEGVFKCPEDQLPLDYAKVSLELQAQPGTRPGHPAGRGTSPCPQRGSLCPRLAQPRRLARVPARKQEPFVPPRWETETRCRQRALVRVPAGGSGPGHRAHGSPLGWGGGWRGLVRDADIPVLSCSPTDLPRPRAGGASVEPGHPLHPQRGGLPLERAHQTPPGRSWWAGEEQGCTLGCPGPPP